MNPRPAVIVRRSSDNPPGSRGPAAGSSGEAGKAAVPDLPAGEPHTLLVVDDSSIHVKLLARQLAAGLGCRILAADTAEEAIGHLLVTQPDLIVTDLMMPDIDGMDLMMALDTREEWRDIPIVVNSAVGDQERVRSLKGARMREYLLKPFNPDIAIPRLRRILQSLPPPNSIPPAPPPPSPSPSDGIPIVVACGPEEGNTIRKATPPGYDLSIAPSGPAALVATVALRPWTVFVTPDVPAWGLPKTVRALVALKGAGRVRTIPLPKLDDGRTAIAALRRELANGPFDLVVDDASATVRISETFTPSCIRALRRDIDGLSSAGLERIVVDIPVQGIQRPALLVLQDLVQALRGDGEGADTPSPVSVRRPNP